jgi:ferredoxin
MKVSVDPDKCVAAGLCVLSEESVFDQDEDTGRVRLLTAEPSVGVTVRVREAARLCPASAITILDDATA